MVTYIMAAIVAVLLIAIVIIIFRFRTIAIRRSATMSKDEVIGRLFIRKMRKLREETNGPPGVMFVKLNRVMRSFFSELFDIKYQFAYVELNEELTRKGVGEDIRNEVIGYTMSVSEAEYGGRDISAETLAAMFDRSLRLLEKVTGVSEKEAAKGPEPPQKESKEGVAKPQEQPAAQQNAAVPEATKLAELQPVQLAAPEAQGAEAPPMPPAPAIKVSGDEPQTAMETAIEKRIGIPKDEQQRLQRLREMLLEAERLITENKHYDALESYSSLREIYDSLSPEVKRSAYSEIKRIISVYNFLLKEYRSALTEKK